MKRFLESPCARCGEYKLTQPEKHGTKTLCLCVGCNKYMGYRVTAGGGYELYLIGGKAGEPKKARLFRLPERHWKATTAEVILALDIHRGF